MPVESDKYPADTKRRRFVKGLVGASALTGMGTAGAAAVNAATNPSGFGGGTTPYIGIERVAGPAPRGMPLIPIEITDGVLKGVWPEVDTRTEAGRQITVAETDIAGVTYSSEWYQYCGVQTYPGVKPGADQDNTFRYAASAPYDWQTNDVAVGDPMEVAHFEDYQDWGNGIGRDGLGKPAMGSWRSVDVPPNGTMPIQVMRVADDQWDRMLENAVNPDFLEEASAENFIAWLDKCTHFCCVPSFKGIAGSEKFDGEDSVYCPCHQSVYDPFSIVQKTFTALPRPE